MTTSFRLTVLEGDERGRSLLLKVPAMIGRGLECDVALRDSSPQPTLSRRHVEISLLNGKLHARDFSRNGVSLDGSPIARQVWVALPDPACLWLGPRHAIRVAQEGTDWPAYDSLFDPGTLKQAWNRVRLNGGGCGIDRITTLEFATDQDREIQLLRDALAGGNYQPLPPRVVGVPKHGGGFRRISVLAVRDRIVQQALLHLLEPAFEPNFSTVSYAYRPGVSAHHALARVDRGVDQGLVWVVDADIERFFDNVRHDFLLQMLATALQDDRLRRLVVRFLALGQAGPGLGLAQGAATSPLYANIYLSPFDRMALSRDRYLVRYADDFVVLCPTREGAHEILLECESFLRTQLSLRLKGSRTRVASVDSGFTFLGFRFDSVGRNPAPAALDSLHSRLEQAGSAGLRKSIQTGWEQYFGPYKTQTGQVEASAKQLGEDDCDLFLRVFRGRGDVYAIQWASPDGRQGYLPRREALSPEAVRRHLKGEETVGLYMLDSANRVNFVVWDVDAAPQAEREGAARLAWQLARAGREFGLPTWVEDSGLKGYHVWLFFSQPCDAALARRLAKTLAARLSDRPTGISLEIFPRQDRSSGLGSLIKLPWGLHQSSGRRCSIFRSEGEPFAEPHDFLREFRAADVEHLQAALKRFDSSLTGHCTPCSVAAVPLRGDLAPEVATILANCTLLQAIVDKPLSTGHLRHAERLTLLHTFGHLGDNGRKFIHQVITRCDNYSFRITQKWVERLDASRRPLGCNRLKDWLSEYEGNMTCRCSKVRGPYRSPVFFAVTPAPTPRSSRQAQLPSQAPTEELHRQEAEWTSVVADFAEMKELPCPHST